jgi:vanillate O-demethylase ferredoxin subunit
LFEGKVVGRSELPGGVATLSIEGFGPDLPLFAAGSHIDLEVAPALVRQYSLLEDPAETGLYRIAVLRQANSRGGSRLIHEAVFPGSRVRFSAPRNSFPLIEDTDDYVFVAGGVGVTPILSMAHRLHRTGRRFTLHYCCRSQQAMAFARELEEAPFASRVRYHFSDASRFDPASDLPRFGGGRIYCCGPARLNDAVRAAAPSVGWPAERVHFEAFSAHPGATDRQVRIVAARSGIELAVGRDQTLADAIIAAGIDLPLSCEAGVCGTCLTRVIEGIPDHRDSYLTAEERAANDTMTPCCSRSLSDRIVLDI